MNDWFETLLVVVTAFSGWVMFALMGWVMEKITATWREVHRLQEERRARDIATMQNLQTHIQLLNHANATLANECTRLRFRGGAPGQATDDSQDADWWKKDGGKPPT